MCDICKKSLRKDTSVDFVQDITPRLHEIMSFMIDSKYLLALFENMNKESEESYIPFFLLMAQFLKNQKGLIDDLEGISIPECLRLNEIPLPSKTESNLAETRLQLKR